MAFTLTAGTSFNSGASSTTTSGTVTLPTGLAAGDVTFLFCSNVATTASITAPAGWNTAVASFQSGGSTAAAVAVFWRAWQSGDGNPSVTCASGKLDVIPVRVQGADPLNPVDVTGTDATLGSSGTSAQIPSVTPAAATILIGLVGTRTGSGATVTWTPPAGFTEIGDDCTSSGTANATAEVFYKTLSSTAATGTATATATAAVNRQGAAIVLNAPQATTGSGAVTLTAAATAGLSFAATGSAAITLTGSATSSTPATTGSAALTLTGAATASLSFATTGSASLTLTGTATSGNNATGGTAQITLTGTATAGLKFATTGTAQLTLTGVAVPYFPPLPSANVARPNVIVEVAFATNPNDAVAVATPAWTDISQYVRGIPTLERSKRSVELDRFEAGIAKLTLDNVDGRFSPVNTSSPYSPYLLPYRLIRIRADVGTELLPDVDTSFEASIGDAIVRTTSGTGSYVFWSAFGYTGSHCVKFSAGTGATTDQAGVSIGAAGGDPSGSAVTVPGQVYTFSAWVLQPSLVGSGVHAWVYSASLAGGSGVHGTATTIVGKWAKVSVTFTATDTRTYVRLLVNGTPTFGQVFYTDALSLRLSTEGIYPLWTGFVERWPQTWADPARGLVDIECVDALAILAQIGMSSIYSSEVLADAPAFYYPLTDDSGSTTAANQSTTSQESAFLFHDSNPSSGNESYGFGGALGVVGADAQTGLTLTRDDASPFPGWGLRLPVVPLDWDAWTIECWVQLDTSLSGIGDIFWVYDVGVYVTEVRCYANGSGFLVVQVTTPDGVTAGTTTTFNVGNGGLHHITMSWSRPTATVWVNDVTVATITCTGSTYNGTLNHLVQLGSRDTNGSGSPIKRADLGASAMHGTIGQFAVYNTALASSRHTTHEQAGRIPLTGQATWLRASTLMSYADWPAAFRWILGSRTTMQAATGIAGRSLLENLQDVADTENGTLSVSSEGYVQVYPRDYRMGLSSPGFVFGSNVAAGEVPYQLSSLTFDFDPTLVYNDVSVARRDGSTARVYDTNSILSYFPRSLSTSSLADNDADSQYAAQWLLDRYSQPSLRAETITIAAGSLGSDVLNAWTQVLLLDLHVRVRVNHRPMNAPMISYDGYVDQLSYVIDPDTGQWDIVLQISPAIRDYWILDNSTESLLDQTTRLSY